MCVLIVMLLLEVLWLKLGPLKTSFAVNRHHVIASKYRWLSRTRENYISHKPLSAVPLVVAQVTADAPSCDNISTAKTKTN